MYTAKERAEYNAMRLSTCSRLGITRNQYNHFRRLGERLHRLSEEYCNGFTYDYEATNNEIETNKTCDVIASLAIPHGLYAYFQSDPRGASLYLHSEAMTDSNYTNGCAIF